MESRELQPGQGQLKILERLKWQITKEIVLLWDNHELQGTGPLMLKLHPILQPPQQYIILTNQAPSKTESTSPSSTITRVETRTWTAPSTLKALQRRHTNSTVMFQNWHHSRSSSQREWTKWGKKPRRRINNSLPSWDSTTIHCLPMTSPEINQPMRDSGWKVQSNCRTLIAVIIKVNRVVNGMKMSSNHQDREHHLAPQVETDFPPSSRPLITNPLIWDRVKCLLAKNNEISQLKI